MVFWTELTGENVGYVSFIPPPLPSTPTPLLSPPSQKKMPILWWIVRYVIVISVVSVVLPATVFAVCRMRCARRRVVGAVLFGVGWTWSVVVVVLGLLLFFCSRVACCLPPEG